ncbi:hypothetical protein [Modestobacter sp. Leaf380]|nr:hypothetical protein [Modestobacter sp. Leaf380]
MVSAEASSASVFSSGRITSESERWVNSSLAAASPAPWSGSMGTG